MMDVVGVV
jgi:hypothetical protein